ncbi:MAG TPA: right-handed parallel beta-helix repeat-containing protein [Bacteroidales bacterium]|nr:right-handed parallel beta-helix repeat-containing protein [Bacteroidales bacterium]
MKRKNLILTFLIGFCITGVQAQGLSFPDDANQRGYYDRDYVRYEAEQEKCITDGIILEPSYDQRTVQSEASNQSATNLVNKDSYIEWTSDRAADGLTIRFSLPDDSIGMGTSGNLILYVDGDSIQTITLSSYWAWQYILKSGSKYPDNLPNVNLKFPRMRFDEKHFRLNRVIAENASIRLVKADNNNAPYTIDFIELEKIPDALTFESVPGENKVMYTPESGKLQTFIAENAGKTIFIPEGKYDVDGRIVINGNRTKIIGAGMWYTEIFFSASSDIKSTYNKRGIETYSSEITVEGMYLNTINNKRYYNNDPVYQVGKGLMGSFGSNSVIKNLWIEHFECGGWIEGSDNLNIQQCRFRNNYADGMNLAYGSKNSVAEHCSYRNNGDDDMASWSRGTGLCENIVYRYSTSENNWRASGLGFFGGKQNKAYNIVIRDPMEAGFRITSDFPGMPFSSDGFSEFYDISVYKGGVSAGSVGVSGDLWGNQQGALHINSSSQYDIMNFRIFNIDLYDSKNDAIFIGSGSKNIQNLFLKDIHIDGTGRYGIYFYNSKGSGAYCNMMYNRIGASSATNTKPVSFAFDEDCEFTGMEQMPGTPGILSFIRDGDLVISGLQNKSVSVYTIKGEKVYQAKIHKDIATVHNLKPGVYVVSWDEGRGMKVLVTGD